jgi:hypothetical protein
MNFKVKNTKTNVCIVTDKEGFDGLIASHTAQMDSFNAALESNLIRAAVGDTGWESTGRCMRIEKTDLPVNLVPFTDSVA